MSEASWGVIGVVIGGIIASITPVITLVIENKKWKRDNRIEHLRIKREKMEQAFGAAHEALLRAVSENIYPFTLLSDIDYIYPKTVSEEFKKMIDDTDKSVEAKKKHLFYISGEMKKYLAEIDSQIEIEIGLKQKE